MNLSNEKLRDLLAWAACLKLRLPNFQRDFVWSLEDQRNLATSLLLELPFGSILLVSGDAASFSARRIGSRVRLEPGGGSVKFLLDGQQRLSAFNSILANPFEGEDWADVVRGTYWNLRYRWSLHVTPLGSEDPFGISTLTLQPLPLDPEELSKRFTPHRVVLAGVSPNDWHHPACPTPEGPNQYLASTATKAADAGLVPLWEIASKGIAATSLHVRALQRIAQSRKDVLEDEIRTRGVSGALRAALTRVRPDMDFHDESQALDALSDLRASWIQDMTVLLTQMVEVELPVSDLPFEQLDRAVLTFESMNRGGTPLSTFDLLTARLATAEPDGNLGELLYRRLSETAIPVTGELWGSLPGERPNEWRPNPDRVGIVKDAISDQFKASFLSVLPLLAGLTSEAKLTKEMTKQKSLLSLHPQTIRDYWEPATDAVLRAWAFLQIRCGVRSESDLRNKLLVLPLAVALRGENSLCNSLLLNRLEYWYWCSVLTSTYTERQNDNAIEDATKLITWAATGAKSEDPFKPRRDRVLKDPGYSDRDTLMRNGEDAGVATDVGRYLLQYELSQLPYDILSSGRADDTRLNAWSSLTQDHHLVPIGSASKVGESSHRIRSGNKSKERIGRLLNSPLNRSLISADSNGKIRDMGIRQYLESVPEVARVNRGLPALAELHFEDAESSAIQVMDHRFQRILDRTIEELDSLLDATH